MRFFILVLLFFIVKSVNGQITYSYFNYYKMRNMIFSEKNIDSLTVDSIFIEMLKYELPIYEIKYLKKKCSTLPYLSEELKLQIKLKLKLRKNKVINSDYSASIKKIYDLDQKSRKVKKGQNNFLLTDSLNKIDLLKLIQKYGIPTYSSVNDETIERFGLLINHYILDDNFVNLDKIDYYFDNGAISGFWATWAIDKYLIVVCNRDKSYFNRFFINKFQFETNKNLIVERLKKYGIEYAPSVIFF